VPAPKETDVELAQPAAAGKSAAALASPNHAKAR
jgi:hypothetical protein